MTEARRRRGATCVSSAKGYRFGNRPKGSTPTMIDVHRSWIVTPRSRRYEKRWWLNQRPAAPEPPETRKPRARTQVAAAVQVLGPLVRRRAESPLGAADRHAGEGGVSRAADHPTDAEGHLLAEDEDALLGAVLGLELLAEHLVHLVQRHEEGPRRSWTQCSARC